MKGCVIEHAVVRETAFRFERRATEEQGVPMLPRPFLETDLCLVQHTRDRRRREHVQRDRSAGGISNEKLDGTKLTRRAAGGIGTGLNRDVWRGQMNETSEDA